MLLRLPVNGSPNRSPMPIRRGSRCSARTSKPGWWTTGIWSSIARRSTRIWPRWPVSVPHPPRISSPRPMPHWRTMSTRTTHACWLRVIRAGVPVTMYDLTLPSLETGYRFEVDGAPRTLGELRDLARAQARDARVEFAFCAAARGAPQLAREPYRAFDVRARMQRLAARAMSDPRLVRIDHEKGKLLIGVPIWSRARGFSGDLSAGNGQRVRHRVELPDAPGRGAASRIPGPRDGLSPTGHALRSHPRCVETQPRAVVPIPIGAFDS
jgi:hypothetical protein